jgi:hypothetical protein
MNLNLHFSPHHEKFIARHQRGFNLPDIYATTYGELLDKTYDNQVAMVNQAAKRKPKKLIDTFEVASLICWLSRQEIRWIEQLGVKLVPETERWKKLSSKTLFDDLDAKTQQALLEQGLKL